MEEGLKIHLGLDDKDVEKGLDKVGKKVADFSNSVGKIKAVGFDDLNTKLRNVPGAANQANLALVDLGRVAQDLPYGFIGIANNLNPLFESFGRLRKETGSTGGALGALAGALKGPGGIGFALSAVTAALSFAQLGMAMWSRRTGEAKQKVVEMSGYLGTTKDELSQINTKFAEEASRISVLVKALESGTLSHQKIKAAKQELISIAPQYFANIDKESTKISEVTAAYNNYNNALVKSIENQIKTDKLTKAIASRLSIEEKNPLGLAEFQKLLKSGKTVDDIIGDIGKSNVRETLQDVNKLTGLYTNVGKAAQLALQDQQKKTEEVTAKNKALQRELYNVATAYQSVEKILGTINPELVKIKPSELLKERKKIEAALHGLQSVDIPISFGGAEIIGKSATAAYKNFKEYWDEQARKNPLFLEAPKIKMDGISGQYEKYFTAAMKKAIDASKRAQEVLKNFNEQTKQTLEQGFTEAISGVGDAIGSLIAGGTEGLSAFAVVGVALGNILQQVGKAAIGTGLAILGIQKALKSLNPYVAIAAGVALVALGSVIKNKLGKAAAPVGMATGGIVPPGYPNDSFPARLSSNEAVIPLDRLDSIMGSGSGGGFIAETRISANDLVLLVRRGERSQRRSF